MHANNKKYRLSVYTNMKGFLKIPKIEILLAHHHYLDHITVHYRTSTEPVVIQNVIIQNI